MPDVYRHRSRGVFQDPLLDAQNWRLWESCADNEFVPDTLPYASIHKGVVETMSDVVTPHFAKRSMVNKEIFMNPLSYLRREVSYIPGFGFHVQRQTDNITCSGSVQKYEGKAEGAWFAALMASLHGSPPPIVGVIPDKEVADLQTEVSTKCLAERGNSSNNLFESIAEYKQTLQMLKSPFKSLNRFLSKNESAIKRIDSAASAWLQYRYGIKPLIKDITGIIEGLKKDVGDKRVTTRARGEIMRVSNSTHSFIEAGKYELIYGIQKTENVQVRAMSLDEYFVSQSENIGFSAKGLITVPWELVPYSFVADWFVNLGDYLKALVPLPSLKQLGSCVTTRRFIHNLYAPLGTFGQANFTVIRQATGSVSVSSLSKVRVPSLQPGFVIRSDFRFDDAVRLADSASLILQKMNTLFSRR